MKQGYLKDYFDIVAVKRLSAVEVDRGASNQHELNGTTALKEVLGTSAGERQEFVTRFVWIGPEGDALTTDGTVTWYDARQQHPTRSEYRLYYPTTVMSELAEPGDSLFVARRSENTLMMIVTAANTTVEHQLHWLFGVEDITGTAFNSRAIDSEAQLDFATRIVFDELGIDIEEPEADQLDELLAVFKGKIPPTAEFSRFARDSLDHISARDDPDEALIAWLQQEERLFKRMERQQIEEKLETGFVNSGQTDVDGFLKFSLTIQNRRKSRAGLSFEHHIAAVLDAHGIRYAHDKKVEYGSRPDFVFPGVDEYHDQNFPQASLTMLGAKTTCKDRWRQVLAEAPRIPEKHLITIEPAISENQTKEMQAHNLQLVVPESLHETFGVAQRSWLMDVAGFIELVGLRGSGRKL